MTLFLRMVLWLRRPPSPGRVALVLGTLALCLVVVGIEAIWGWPDWLTVNRRFRP